MPKITKGGVSDASQDDGQPVDAPVNELTPAGGETVAVISTAEAEVTKPKKAAPRKATR